MKVHKIDSRKMSSSQEFRCIEAFTQLGWVYQGKDYFPTPHIWLTFKWDNENEPRYPEEAQ